MERISWDQYFMAQTHLLALRSTCTRLMVGALIVRDNRIIAGGYNGSVSGGVHCIDEGCYIIDGHCVRTVHAEANAILQCAKFGVATEGASIYVTHFPCLQCCKQLIQAGIKNIYFANDYRNHGFAEELFAEANVNMKQVKLEDAAIEYNYIEKQELVQNLLDVMDEKIEADEDLELLKAKAKTLFHYEE